MISAAPHQFRSSGNYESMESNLEINGKDIYVTFTAEFSEKPIRLLVDTGASISLISEKAIKSNTKLKNLNVKLYGFSSKDHCIQSFKAIDGFVNMATDENSKIGATFHVIPSTYTGDADGFLGADFILYYKTILDFGRLKLILPENIEKKPGTDTTNEKEDENEQLINITYDEDKRLENQGVVEMLRTTDAIICPEEDEITDELRHYCNKILNPKEYIYLVREITPAMKVSTITNCSNKIHRTKLKNIEHETTTESKNQIVCTISESIRTNGTQSNTPRHFENDQERSKYIYEKIKKDHCNTEEKENIQKWCKSYSKQFHVDGDHLACTKIIKHKIILKPNTVPPNIRQYRIPQTHKQKLNEMIEEYEKQGIIEKCVVC